ncbi:MAG: cytochrome P450 [Hyphomicrobiales bacterium]|nr:cytochrome P450 [Hyphomicrobiales bacterium]
MTGTSPPLLDPLSRSFAQDPYRVYDQMRAMDAPWYFEAQDMLMLARYADVCAVATSPYAVRSLEGLETPQELARRQRQANWHDMPYHERVVQFSLLDSDGAVHRRLRKLVFGFFKTDAVGRLETTVQDYVDRLLDQLQDRQEIEFIEDFAAHIPGFVIGKLLGAPEQDCPQLRLWSEQVVQFFDVDRSDEKKQLAETATRDFYHYLADLKKERTAKPQDDLISRMIEDDKAGLYSQDEFISTCMLILMAGHGSTIDVLGSGMHTLLKHPDAMASLRADPEPLPVAIQEMFRYESPLPFFHRHMTQDFTLGDTTYPAGTTFGLLYGAANRDPAQFDAANEFHIHRSPNRHLAFGQGAHLCLGNNLARMNMKVIFATLLRRFSAFEQVDDEVEYKPGLSVRGVKRLNLAWTAS